MLFVIKEIIESTDPERDVLIEDFRKRSHQLLRLLDTSLPSFEKLKVSLLLFRISELYLLNYFTIYNYHFLCENIHL